MRWKLLRLVLSSGFAAWWFLHSVYHWLDAAVTVETMPEGIRQLSAAAEAVLGRPLALSDLIVAAFPLIALASFLPEAKEYVRRLLGHSKPALVIDFYEEFDPHPPSGKPFFPPYRRT